MPRIGLNCNYDYLKFLGYASVRIWKIFSDKIMIVLNWTRGKNDVMIVKAEIGL